MFFIIIIVIATVVGTGAWGSAQVPVPVTSASPHDYWGFLIVKYQFIELHGIGTEGANDL